MEDYEQKIIFAANDEDPDVRKGPWTEEEDAILTNYVSLHGKDHWNNIARSSGLKRTGKSCRLRWLNYLRPDVRRGNITLEEQFMILKLHSHWGNRWSKIAQHLPGRTDNEIKNYWRTRVQKQAKHLNCEVNSNLFKETMRNVWMPRLLERIHAQSTASTCQTGEPAITEPVQPDLAPTEPGSVMSMNPNQQFMASEFSPETQMPHSLISSFTQKGCEGFGEFGDWNYDDDTILKESWNEDSFWNLHDQFLDETSYSSNYF